MTSSIRPVEYRDMEGLCRLYNPYVTDSVATFEEVEVSPEEMAHRVSVVTRHFPWLVYEDQGQVLGFAYGNYWKSRSAYRHSLETTIYLAGDWLGRGVGSRLYGALVEELRGLGQAHRLLACISLPNAASVALHEKLGYRKVGHFSESGRKFERWIDVGYWQLDL